MGVAHSDRYGGAVLENHPTPVRSPRVAVHGIEFDAVTEADAVDFVLHEIDHRRGGRIVTPNVDIVRLASTRVEARAHLDAASLVLADGAPLLWASRLAGTALPARVPGSDLIWSISAALAERHGALYLLGGEPGTADIAATVLADRHPGLRVVGAVSPPFGFDTRPDEYAAVCADVVAAEPDVVFVGLGFPKQENVIERLRPHLPSAWFMGCGAAIGFVAGTHRRAPQWMQRSGLEWLHRLSREPHRLVRRYLIDDLPFAVRLLATSVVSRLRADRPATNPNR